MVDRNHRSLEGIRPSEGRKKGLCNRTTIMLMDAILTAASLSAGRGVGYEGPSRAVTERSTSGPFRLQVQVLGLLDLQDVFFELEV